MFQSLAGSDGTCLRGSTYLWVLSAQQASCRLSPCLCWILSCRGDGLAYTDSRYFFHHSLIGWDDVEKVLADVLTFIRAVLAVIHHHTGGRAPCRGIGCRDATAAAAWITDFADGPLARSSGYEGSTWIGRHDIHIDVLIGLSLLAFLVLAGSINVYIALIYVLIWAVVFWRMGELPKATGALFQGPIYILFGLLASNRSAVGVWLGALCRGDHGLYLEAIHGARIPRVHRGGPRVPGERRARAQTIVPSSSP